MFSLAYDKILSITTLYQRSSHYATKKKAAKKKIAKKK